MENRCWLCHRNGASDRLDKHHIFGGVNRRFSEEDGLVVWLCHNSCHIFGPDAVHRNAETMQRLHEYGERLWLNNTGKTIADFRERYGKNYLEEEDDDSK